MEVGPVRGGRRHRVMRVGEDRKRVVSAVPIVGYGVKVSGVYAKVHPQEGMVGGKGISRGMVPQG